MGRNMLQAMTNEISIHALLAESDHAGCLHHPTAPRISIHALLAESDPQDQPETVQGHISIHALLAESDLGNVAAFRPRSDFYPRSPCGERRGLYDLHCFSS